MTEKIVKTTNLKKLYVFLTLILFTSLLADVTVGEFENGSYTNFVLRPDSKGNHIEAHHGGIIFFNGKYRWYGQTFKEKSSKQGGATTDIGVVMYCNNLKFLLKFDFRPLGALLRVMV